MRERLIFGEGGREKEEGEDREVSFGASSSGGKDQAGAMGRFRGILRQMRISLEEEMMLLGLPVVSTWLEEAWPPF